MIPYDLDALKAENDRIDKHIAMFEEKIKEMRDSKTQNSIWIAQLEAQK